jgi:group II intron reverse transcriptase/maturase
MLKHPELFVNAYGKLYKNSGAMTPGVDGETVDGTSLEKIQRLIQDLRDRTFRWTPVRRHNIDKGGGKKRPLGIPTWRDKLVQEVIRTILEAYYEPQFSDQSHGFRPRKGCHTALVECSKYTGTTWIIEGDIKGCFDAIDHEILLRILARNIKDASFLKLIHAMLKAGYMEDWVYHDTYSGTPQGGIVSPILANIFLNELDQWVESIRPQYQRGKYRARNPEYHRISERIRLARNSPREDWKERLKRYQADQRETPSRLAHDPNYRRLGYVRYSDDFVLLFTGPKEEAKEIKQALSTFLSNVLNLELSEEKTLITHAATQRAKFLGYEIHYPRNPHRRSTTGKAMYHVPQDAGRKWIKKYSKKGKPHHEPRLLHFTDAEIVQRYEVSLRGLYNYYQYAHNVGDAIGKIHYTMLRSLVFTLARKPKIRPSKVYEKYAQRGKHRKTCIAATTAQGREAVYGDISLSRTPMRNKARQFVGVELNDKIQWQYYGRNELVGRLLLGECEIPGCTNEGVEGHHVRALKDLDRKYSRKGVTTPEWAKIMKGRRRKTLIVCEHHHKQIHRGKYDGPSLKKLAGECAMSCNIGIVRRPNQSSWKYSESNA